MDTKTKIILVLIGILLLSVIMVNLGDSPIQAPSVPDGNLWE